MKPAVSTSRLILGRRRDKSAERSDIGLFYALRTCLFLDPILWLSAGVFSPSLVMPLVRSIAICSGRIPIKAARAPVCPPAYHDSPGCSVCWTAGTATVWPDLAATHSVGPSFCYSLCRFGDCTPAPSLFVWSHLQRNSACISLAECYESLGDYGQALRYAHLADTTYPCRSGCGTCDDSMRNEAEKRVERLQALVEWPVPSDQPHLAQP